MSLAQELLDAFQTGRIVPPPSARNAAFDLTSAYAVENEIAWLRRAAGRRTVGRKVGFANQAVWRKLKLETVVWAHMYDDTVHHCSPAATMSRLAAGNETTWSMAGRVAPKIEPEIVFKLARPIPAGADASAALDAVEWMALGFELIDCPFPDWQFQPVDFLAALGLHAGLIVGEPRTIASDSTDALVEQLATFTVKLSENGTVVEEGSGKNVLKSPALCLAELATASAARSVPLAPGELISTGTLTTSRLISAGQTWTAVVDGIDLPALSVRIS